MRFVKLEATGNDFVVIDAREDDRDWATLAAEMCRRHLGIGADGIILVGRSQTADSRMRIFNADGSEAEACGNGLRCFTKYVVERQILTGRAFSVETLAGVRSVQPRLDGKKVLWVDTNMGPPRFSPQDIPVNTEADSVPILDYRLDLGATELTLSLLSMGNPHAVTFVSKPLATFPLEELGPKVETAAVFPQRTNFEVATIVGRGRIEARVWGRGVGETLACGSGACAIGVAAQLKGQVERRVEVSLPGGVVTVEWDGAGGVWLGGPVREVFTGEWPEGEGE